MLAWSGNDRGVTNLIHEPRWSIDEIDWQRFETPEGSIAAVQRRLVSHLLAGERLAEAICARLIDESGDSPARVGLVRQLADEQRHQAVFARYLDMLGDAAHEDAFAPAFEAVTAWRGPPAALLVAGHVLLECDAIDAAVLLRNVPCPLLASLCRLVTRDEARHVAFGRALLAAELKHLDRATRLEIYAWARRSWMQNATLTLRRFAGIGWFARGGAAALWQRHYRRLVAIGLLA